MARLGVYPAAFLLMLMPAAVGAASGVRCGTDDFGNAVCIDRDGVMTTAPQSGQTAGGDGKAADQSGSQRERDAANGRPRCGIDPFGNKVCR